MQNLKLFALLFFIGSLSSAQPVRPTDYPQKFRTFVPLGDPSVPAMKSTDVTASDGARWTATREGLYRRHPKSAVRDRVQFFGGRRYLPDGPITGLAPDRSGGVFVATASGVSHIEFRPMTLEEKASAFEERVRLRHLRHGFTADSDLREPGNLATSYTISTDNDGLWTAMYVGAELFRFAASHSKEALANARQGLEALLFLEQITGRPGFPARSYIDATEQRPSDGTWHPTADGKLQWKGDTSSDEIVGHMFAFALGWDHLPASDPLRPRIAATCRRIMDHIIANGYNLIDVTGKPTTWGQWSQAYFDTPGGNPDSPLNAVELLSFLRTTHHITGDEKYAREYDKVAVDLNYAERTARYTELCHEINYSDEELAMLSFYPLFIYEHDPKYQALYSKAADQWWKNIKRELNPLWTAIYALGRPELELTEDYAGAVWTLRRFPMDLITWNIDNSHRSDLPSDKSPERFNEHQTAKLIPPDERPVMKWNSNPFRLKGGNGGRSEDDGATYLLAYWLARYHRLPMTP